MSVEGDAMALGNPEAGAKQVEVVAEPVPQVETLEKVAQPTMSKEAMLALVSTGDLAKLTPDQRLDFYLYRCRQAGLDPGTRPFQFITLNNKLVLYAGREAADQISYNKGYTIWIKEKKVEADTILITVGIKDREGTREGEDMSAVYIKGLTGEALANAWMKAYTKAKRRAILSFSGLGLLDESEAASVAGMGKGPGDMKDLPTPTITPVK